jgi:hypothetical protein
MITLEDGDGVSRPVVESELIVDYWIWVTKNDQPDNDYKGDL